MVSVSYTYNGSNQLDAVATGLVPGDVYSFRCGDPDSSPDDQTADGGGGASFSVDDIGGLSAGDQFGCWLIHGGIGSIPGGITGHITYTQANIVEYGTPSNANAGDLDTFAYDGVDVYQVTFVAVGGVTYTAEVFTWDDYQSANGGPYSDGTTQTIVLPAMAASTPGDPVVCDLWNDAFTKIFAARVFVDGVAGAGDPGNGAGGGPPGPRVQIPVVALVRGGALRGPQTDADTDAGNYIAPIVPGLFIEIESSDGSDQTVTVRPSPRFSEQDGLNVQGLVISVPAGEKVWCAPYKISTFRQSTDLKEMFLDSSVSGTLKFRAGIVPPVSS